MNRQNLLGKASTRNWHLDHFYARKMLEKDNRTALVKKNIAGSFLVKGWSCVVQLLLVPLTLQCLNQYEYGIWLTINSLLLWIDQFDIGLGNGLRNKLAEVLALGDHERARRLVSTTFLMLIMIMLPLTLAGIAIVSGIDCYKFLNVNPSLVPNLPGIIIVAISFVGMTFVFKFIGNVYLGLQLPAISNFLTVMGQTVSLVIIFALSLAGSHSLMAVAIAYTLSPLIVYLVSYPVTFTRYKYLSPSFKMFSKAELNSLFTLGIKFFFVQIAGLVIFASSNLLISKLISPSEVTPYQISYRYFSVSLMLFTIIANPLWSATTDAYTKNDWNWIGNMMRNLRKVMLGFALMLVIMAVAAPFVYRIWVGSEVEIPSSLTWATALYIAVIIYSTAYSNILYGIGKIRLITIITVIEAIAFIPLAIFMGKAAGLCGIIGALTLVNTLCAVTNRIQYQKLYSNSAKGIWNK